MLFRRRSSVAKFIVCFCHGFIFLGQTYYLPLYFQGVLGASPIMSGVYLLPLIISIAMTAALAGLFIQQTGKYFPTVWVGTGLTILGVGLFINLDASHNWGKFIKFQIIAGAGVGANFDGPLLARLHEKSFNGSVGSHWRSGLSKSDSKEGPSLIDVLGEELAGQIADAGATSNVELIETLPSAQKAVVQHAFYRSLGTMWIMYVAFSALGLLAGFFMDTHHLKKEHEAAVLGLRVMNSDERPSESANTTTSTP
ncbi:major facilitator superfamily domain-containing protein [Penicillium citrinum]|uniref:Major facilitator superfamily domain-containing protein n=1 Tax=Penicillium citrinum TaxID=5077 RepID=A0A9W9NJE4_PENCI|nr:major facilitator superfamily domain-containing protein [Penicillium citrinum]KAJ5221070.1 major facilitator superfamily domain-containing protein [Penicillium citrinum]